MATTTIRGSHLEEVATDLFEVVTQLCLVTPRSRRRLGDLKETEFLTLSLLHERTTMHVGEIQKLLNVLPAQMSRVIRSLEGRLLIACRINSNDKRKIDVVLTDEGLRALQQYQSTRIQRIADLLHDLTEEDQEGLVHLLDKVRHLLELRPGA